MKRLILSLSILAFTLGMNAQNETFTYPNNVGDELSGQYIVIEEKGTPQENYSKVINYINKTYNTPAEVIKSQIKDEYLRIEGVSGLFKNAGATVSTRHSLEFKFKQDRIKLTILNLQEATQGMNISVYCTYDKTHRSNGKIRKTYMDYAVRVVDGLNELSKDIKTGIAQESSETPDDDW